MRTNVPAIDPEYSVPFNVHTWSDHPEVNSLVDTVWNILSVDIQTALIGKSNNKCTPPKRIPKKLLKDLNVNWLDDPLMCRSCTRQRCMDTHIKIQCTAYPTSN